MMTRSPLPTVEKSMGVIPYPDIKFERNVMGREYKWRVCSGSISVKGQQTLMMKAFQAGVDNAKECMSHSMNEVLLSGKARRYRRGKNRCLRCGWHLNPAMTED